MSKVAIVTGSSKGIGLAIAKMLVVRGWEVVGISKSNKKEKLSFKTLEFDLSRVEKLKELVNKLPPKVYLLVNNAGTAYRKGIKDLEIDDFENIFNLNLKTPIMLTKLLLPGMSSGSVVINISSDVSCMGLPGYTVYAASKASINRFTTTLAKEKKDVKVIGILPSMVDTPLLRSGRGVNFDYSKVLKSEDIAKIVGRVLDGEFKSGDLIVATNNHMLKWWKDRDKHQVFNVDNQ
jgi:NAD(P)-dependent dehydrogenase (short-subunit alcohol dehydrogenase family)